MATGCTAPDGETSSPPHCWELWGRVRDRNGKEFKGLDLLLRRGNARLFSGCWRAARELPKSRGIPARAK